ncbi:peroxidase 7 [Mercurialis annua]|uniref:peroxidase 7 n=1 Tax=Mercurialis annua TaxID=3986 RepID=UPI00215FD2D0|nr:peroxidase 7 [Mercurialis annua]
MKLLISLVFLLLAFQLISASQYYPDNSSPQRQYPENNADQNQKEPGNYSEQPANYSEQKKTQPENFSDEKGQSGNYSEEKEEKPVDYAKHNESQPAGNYGPENSSPQPQYPENNADENEKKPGNYPEQPGKYSEQKKPQPEKYSEQKEEKPEDYAKHNEQKPAENYSKQKEEKPENDEQSGNYSEQKNENPENYSEEEQGEEYGDGPSLTISTLLDGLPSLDDLLSFVHYHRSCPKAESIINRKVKEWFKKDYTVAAALLRLHFHDCAVRGCDASILLDYEGSERRAEESKSLRGFEVIDEIKAEIEKVCPKTVSCADILTAAARDATVLLGGPYWMVPYGRKDGKVSVYTETRLVPTGLENITTLIEFYQSNGLNVVDLVVLSGAHTIGRATCGSIQHRLYNYEGTGKPDPSLDTKYLNFLTRKCRWASEYVDLDGSTPTTFDNEYYQNLQKNMGLLMSDQLLYSDPRTAPLVDTFASAPEVFYHQFAVSMTKLGNILIPSVLDDGEIRTFCGSVNSY